MFDAKQIKKIQKKAAPIVNIRLKNLEDAEKKRIEEQNRKKKEHFTKNILPHLIEIRDNIKRIQETHKDRGACFCVWKSKIYVLTENKAKETDINFDAAFKYIELIEVANEKEYYMCKKDFFQKENKIYEWLIKHYATLKIAVAQMKSSVNLSNALLVGNLVDDFTKNFPEKSPYDLIEYIKTFDIVMNNFCQNKTI